jgi:hypothetical protein
MKELQSSDWKKASSQIQKKAINRVEATNTNNILSSYRNGPVKVNPGTSLPQGSAQKSIPNKPQEQPIAKKIRVQSSQHKRPASPGIRGKIYEEPYKNYVNTLKSNNTFILFL